MTQYEETIYSIISTFFVDNYYNAIYTTAKEQSSTGGYSITETYISLVRQFIASLHTDTSTYRQIAKRLLAYYEANVGTSLVTFADFENRVIEIFVPREYHSFIQSQQRERNMAYIINEVAKSIGLRIIKHDQIRGVIDHRDDYSLIENIKLYGQTSLRLLKEAMHAKYAEVSINGTNPQNKGLSQIQIQKVHSMVEKLAQEKKILIEENQSLRKNLVKSIELINKMKIIIEQSNMTYDMQTQHIPRATQRSQKLPSRVNSISDNTINTSRDTLAQPAKLTIPTFEESTVVTKADEPKFAEQPHQDFSSVRDEISLERDEITSSKEQFQNEQNKTEITPEETHINWNDFDLDQDNLNDGI